MKIKTSKVKNQLQLNSKNRVFKLPEIMKMKKLVSNMFMKTHKLMANNTLKKVLTMNKLKIQRAKGNL